MADLIARLYQGPLEERPFSSFLEALRGALASGAATMLIDRPRRDRPGLVLTAGGTAAGAARYLDLFGEDPFIDLGLDRPVTLDEHLGEEGLARSPRLADFLRQTGMTRILGVDIVEPNGARVRLRISRGDEAGDFTAADKALLAPLLPHLALATGLFLRLLGAESERNLYEEALSRLSLGVVLADREGSVLHASALARGYLRPPGSRQLRIEADPGEARALAALIAANADSAMAGTAPPARSLRLGGLSVSVRPAPQPAKLDAPLQGAAVVIIADLDRAVAPRAQSLIELFDLTPAEAEVAVLIARGLDLAEASDRLGIAKNTGRAHLRAIFAKTGVARQSQLVRLLLRSADELA